MRILHINVFDVYGGAETIMRRLCQGLLDKRHQVSCLVLKKNREKHNYPVKTFRHDDARCVWSRFWIGVGARLMEGPGRKRMWVRGVSRFLANYCGQPRRAWIKSRGREDFDYPDTEDAIRRIVPVPDLIHIHGFHGQYFDLRKLVPVSRWKPVVVTLHDAWMFTGHCAYPVECERYKSGCGSCPDLQRYPSIARDATDENFRRKKEIYQRSKLHVAAPSRWMMDQLEASALGDCFTDKKVIPNGIDTSKFTPGDGVLARKVWGVPEDTCLLLYVARNARHSPYKDYATVEKAARMVSEQIDRKVHLLVLGEDADEELHDSLTIQFELTTDPEMIIAAYRAADIYLHAAAAENFPTTVLEAMACATPVVATKTGGIPEQIVEAENGYLVTPGDSQSMAQKIIHVLSDDDIKDRLGQAGRARAVEHYDQSVMTERYIEWYKEIARS